MSVKFKKLSGFNRGTLFELLTDAYSFDRRYEQSSIFDWQDFDNFFFDHLQIADKYAFITTVNDEPIGFVTWDPRNMPDYAEIGHNCIASKHKGNGYGKIQLQEAVNRISHNDVKKIIVTTNDDLTPAQRMYESIGFTMLQKRKSETGANFIEEFIDYVYFL
ncbi:Acetyltransferase (GNAT) family protein [compost metagenome]